MTYIDGYVLPVPKGKLAAYKKVATAAGKMWIKHGALSYIESVGEDFDAVKEFKGLSFLKMAKAAKTETVIFAYITYKSKAHRNKVNKNVMSDPWMKDPKNQDIPMPFDVKKMAYAGFKTIVELKQKKKKKR